MWCALEADAVVGRRSNTWDGKVLIENLGCMQRQVEEEDEDDGIDPDMAAAMGFAGFSGGR